MKVNRKLISFPKEAALFESIGTHILCSLRGMIMALLPPCSSSVCHPSFTVNCQKKQKTKAQQIKPLQVFDIFHIVDTFSACYKQGYLVPSGNCIFGYTHSPSSYFNTTKPHLHSFGKNVIVLLQISWKISAYFKDQSVSPLIPDDSMKPKSSYLKQW